MTNLIEKVSRWALHLIGAFGYKGLFLTMMLESAAVPLPSEVIVPFGGFLAFSGRFKFWAVVATTTLANLTGACLLYLAGYYSSRWAWRRYFSFYQHDIQKVEKALQKYGGAVAFFSRLIPGTRTFSSLVIGAGKINFALFFWYTLAGSFLWNLIWTYLGYTAGSRWLEWQPYVRIFDYVLIAAVVVVSILFLHKHLRHHQHE